MTVGLFYRMPNMSIEESDKLQNAINEVTKRDYVIMRYFSHGHIQWKSPQSTGSDTM